MSGPIPKRESERRRRNQDGGPVDHGVAGERPTAEDMAADPEWHDLAKKWFESLARSGQHVYYEPSDWAHARIVADALSRNLSSGKFSAMLFAAVDTASTRLMVTEGDRRRLRLELDRGPQVDEDEDAAVTKLHEYRNRLAGA